MLEIYLYVENLTIKMWNVYDSQAFSGTFIKSQNALGGVNDKCEIALSILQMVLLWLT